MVLRPWVLLLVFSVGALNPCAIARETAARKKPAELPPKPVEPPPVLGKARGTLMTISGRFIERDGHGVQADSLFRIMRIDRTATQEDLIIQVRRPGAFAPVDVIPGEHFAFRGFESGRWIGPSGEALTAAIPGKSTRYSPLFIVSRQPPIPPVTYSPDQFEGRRAWLQGTAVNADGRAALETQGWRAILEGAPLWPDAALGKKAEVIGKVERRSDGQGFVVTGAAAGLSRLEDQLGQAVTLRGRPRTRDGHWWFEFRGQNLYVDRHTAANGWRSDYRDREVLVSGRLEKRRQPRLDEVGGRAPTAQAEYFTVTAAQWSAVAEADRGIAVPFSGDLPVFYPDGHW